MRRLLVTCVFFTAIAGGAHAGQSPQTPLDPAAIPQFAQPLPSLSGAPQNSTLTTVVGSRPLTLRMCEFRARVLPDGAVAGYGGTWTWGYLVDPTGNSTCAQLIALYGGTNGIVDSYIGPVIVNHRGTPTEITWINNLGEATATNVLAYRYSTDQTIHWADPLHDSARCGMESLVPAFGSLCAQNYSGPIAAVAHLHGGEVPPEIDGGPDAWFTSDGSSKGSRYYSKSGAAPNSATYRYPNTQQAAAIWFHDHVLGATRLNVYAGLAGAYLIDDAAQRLPQNLPALNEVVPLVLQDRMFDTDGQLYFPAAVPDGVAVAPNPEHPYWVPEFIGDTIVVNGKAWPYLEVEPRRYRFLLLNGSNSRGYELRLENQGPSTKAPAMYVIATDGGYLDVAVQVGGMGEARRRRAVNPMPAAAGSRSLLIMPGERYEVIIDFAGFTAGTRLVLRNTAGAPFPDGDAPEPETTGRMLQFRVTSCASGKCGANDRSYDPAVTRAIRSADQKIVRLADPELGVVAPGVTLSATRQLTLNEVLAEGKTTIDPVSGTVTDYEGGPMEILVNNTEFRGEGARPYDDFTVVTAQGVTTAFSETPVEGTTEVWEIVNLTADAHPIHLHLVQFQLVNRQAFDLDSYAESYEKSFPGGRYVQGFGPPLDYRAGRNPQSGGKLGGNPDVAPFLAGRARPPLPQEAGWKDTVVAYPGEVTRLAVRWAPTDVPLNAAAGALAFPFDPSGEGGAFAYVWHCHIIDHEDNEMMRPHTVLPNAAAGPRKVRRGTDY